MLIFLLGAVIYNVVADTAIAYALGIRSKKGMAIIALTNVLTTIFLTNPCFMFAMGSALVYACGLPILQAVALAVEAAVYYIFSQTIPHPIKVAAITNIGSMALLFTLFPILLPILGGMFNIINNLMNLLR